MVVREQEVKPGEVCELGIAWEAKIVSVQTVGGKVLLGYLDTDFFSNQKRKFVLKHDGDPIEIRERYVGSTIFEDKAIYVFEKI